MRVAVIGATGVVGQTILRVLDERKIAVDALLAYASRDRTGGSERFGHLLRRIVA
ncbi:MAG: hypothetical protein PVSMB8_13280 [Vulcanimicrobiaceae bacterium]